MRREGPWLAKRKFAAVLRMLRGEDLETLPRDLRTDRPNEYRSAVEHPNSRLLYKWRKTAHGKAW